MPSRLTYQSCLSDQEFEELYISVGDWLVGSSDFAPHLQIFADEYVLLVVRGIVAIHVGQIPYIWTYRTKQYSTMTLR